jgi:hypothetical protein
MDLNRAVGALSGQRIFMTFEEWEERYQPVANILNQDAPFEGLMFETYGAEFGMIWAVAEARPNSVWTIVEGDNGHRFLSAGYHLVNRVGYLLTVNPWSDANLSDDIDLDAGLDFCECGEPVDEAGVPCGKCDFKGED